MVTFRAISAGEAWEAVEESRNKTLQNKKGAK